MIIRNRACLRSIQTFIPRRCLSNTRSECWITLSLGPSILRSIITNTTKAKHNTDKAQGPNESLIFEGNTTLVGTPEERMMNVFGGRIKGDVRQSSSRRDIGQPRLIAGILVPDKPTEPNNCCMSGCVNCVWEQFNDDLKDWRRLRNEAAQNLNTTDQIWPSDFHPPLAALNMKNVPKELKKQKLKADLPKKRISSAAYFPPKGAKPGAQHAKAVASEVFEDQSEQDDWENVPVSFRVFAETERKMKAKRLEKQRKLEEEQKKAKEVSTDTEQKVADPGAISQTP